MEIKRSEIIFMYDIKDNNPNGDPLDSNKPRIDEEKNINIVTDVRLKRTVRDYIKDYKKEEIFVREIRKEDGSVQDAKERAKDFGENEKAVHKNVVEKCIDVRLFGATIPTEFEKKKTGSITFTGPVQFNIGRSMHKVALKRIKGTGGFASDKGKENKTFREEYILPYSFICFNGLINENAAKITNLSQDDIDLLLDAMWNGTKNLISRSKVGQMPRVLIKVNYKENNFHIGDLHKDIKLNTDLIDEESIRDLNEFSLDFTEFKKSIDIFKEKIDSIEYIIDRKVSVTLNKKEAKTEEIFQDINKKELKL